MNTDELRAMWKKMDDKAREDSERRIQHIVVGVVIGFILIIVFVGTYGRW